MQSRDLYNFTCAHGRSLIVARSTFKPKRKTVSLQSKKKQKQSFLSGITDAIDFAQVRSESDRDLLDAAKFKLGGSKKKGKEKEKMSREQYQALRRKVGGTARDYWKDYIQADEVKGYSSTENTIVPALPFLLAVVIGIVIATGVVVAQTSVNASNTIDNLVKQQENTWEKAE